MERGLNNEKTLYTFKNKIKNLSKQLKQKINTIKRQGKTIHIYEKFNEKRTRPKTS